MPTPHPRPWHRNSVFGDGLRIPMCRERRAVWKARLRMFRRGGKLTPLYEDIGLAMLHRLGKDGRLDPSQQTIADDVGCSARSVRRALVAFRSCSLVCWVQRLVRAGWKVMQTSNAYMLTISDPPVFPASRTGGQAVRQTSSVHKSTELPPVPPPSATEIATAQIALANRQRVIQQKLLNRRVRRL